MFVGAFILPGRIYVSNRVVGNTYNAVRKFNRIAENGFAEAYVEKFVSTMNSYYGLMKHFATYNIRRKIAAMLLPEWWEYVYIEGHFEKFVLKNKYNHRKQLIKHIKNMDQKISYRVGLLSLSSNSRTELGLYVITSGWLVPVRMVKNW